MIKLDINLKVTREELTVIIKSILKANSTNGLFDLEALKLADRLRDQLLEQE